MKVKDEFKPILFGLAIMLLFLIAMAMITSTQKSRPCKIYTATVESIVRSLGNDGHVVKVKIQNFAGEPEKIMNVWTPGAPPQVGAEIPIVPRGSTRRPSSAKNYSYVIGNQSTVKQKLDDGTYIAGN